jgi:hypothetical protein
MRFGLLGGLLAASMLLLGCEAGNTPPAVPSVGQPVPITREFRGQQGSFPDAGYMVVQRPEIWQLLWGNTTAPDVDFSKESVLVATLGQQATAGYDIRITDVRDTGTGIVGYVAQTQPAAGSIVAQVISFPFDMVVVPKLTQPVSYIVESGSVPPVIIQDAFQGFQCNATEPQTLLIHDKIAWAKLWADHFGADAAAPPVDFGKQMAVAIFMGKKPTGGYLVWIPSVLQVDAHLLVNDRTRAPQPGEVVSLAATSPYYIAIIPVSTLPITFK